MKSPSDEPIPVLDHFDQWLASDSVQPRPGMMARIRARMAAEDQAFEQALDTLFTPDPALRNPLMATRVRERLDAMPAPERDNVIWFQWLTPIAAACVLGIALFSFQSKAPSPQLSLAAHEAPTLTVQMDPARDPEITRIFALAANLQGTSDMSRLQSVDSLAFLFE